MNNIDERIEHDEIFTISENDNFTEKKLSEFIERHQALVTKRYKKLYDAYIGDYPILSYEGKDSWKPDNRVVVNFAKYMVDTMNGFFIGVPIKVTSPDEEVNNYIKLLGKYNDQDDNDAELSKICSLYGKGYEFYFVDNIGEIQIVYLNPMEGFMVYDETMLQKPKYFVSYYKDSDDILRGTVYDASKKKSFNSSKGITFEDETIHGFCDIPATEYIENEERMAIFESVYSQINEYNKAISEKANDVDYFADAYLKVLGATVDQEAQKNIKTNRIINFPGEGAGDKVVVEFMSKPNSDQTQEDLLNRLEKHIFQNSMIANINDENFGTSSGIALKYKLLSMGNLAKTKERKFTSGMNRRYKIIFSNPVNKMKTDSWASIEYKFTQNYPTNDLEESEIAGNLSGITSKETQLKALSLVKDAADEIDKIKAESDKISYETDYPTNRTASNIKNKIVKEETNKILSGEL